MSDAAIREALGHLIDAALAYGIWGTDIRNHLWAAKDALAPAVATPEPRPEDVAKRVAEDGAGIDALASTVRNRRIPEGEWDALNAFYHKVVALEVRYCKEDE